jgi:glycosyltransferase involved in cell wall biosynthesis
MITAVIPVYHNKYLPDLLRMIERNTIRPAQIIVVDNSSSCASCQTCSSSLLGIEYLSQPVNIGVNRSWNLGVEKATNPLVAFLNDDIVIPKTLFEQLLSAHSNNRAGFVAPTSAKNPEIPRHWNFVTRTVTQPLTKRLGWCFSILRDIALVADRIPPELFTFFGDDWYFVQSKLQGFDNLQILNCPVYHYGNGVSAGKHTTKLPMSLDEERQLWQRIVSTLL